MPTLLSTANPHERHLNFRYKQAIENINSNLIFVLKFLGF